MGRRLVGGVLVACGLIAASLAWTGYAVSRTLLDPGRSQAIADDIYQDREVRAQMRSSMADALDAAIPDDVSVNRSELVAAADRALDDPAVEALLVGGIIRSHQRFLGEDPDPDEPIVVDGAAMASASRTALVNLRPELINVVPESPSLPVTLPTDRLPDAGGFRAWLNGAVAMLAAVAVGLVVAAFVLTNDRPRVLRRVGFWAIGAAAFWLLVGVVLPQLAHLLLPGPAAIFGAVVGVAAGGMIEPSRNALIAGVGLVILSLLWMAGGALLGRDTAPAPRRQRPRHEPVPVGATRSPVPPPASPSAPPAPAPAPARAPAPAPATAQVAAQPPPPPPPSSMPPPSAPQRAPRWVEGVGYVDDDQTQTG
ncbi:MAG: hypothetical protein ACLFWR_00905 [Acidimicrobiales bacterium]